MEPRTADDATSNREPVKAVPGSPTNKGPNSSAAPWNPRSNFALRSGQIRRLPWQ